MRLIHLTDPHLSNLDGYSFGGLHGKRRSGYLSWRRNRRHIHSKEMLERLTAEVVRQMPDQILLTGDLVHIGLESEIIEAKEWLRRLGPPDKVLLIPGNHDNYAADSQQFMARHWKEYLPEDFQPGQDYTTGYPLVRQVSDVQLIGLNTACVTRVFSAAGRLGDAQKRRIAALTRAGSGSEFFRCLLIHHPPFPAMTKRRKALKDADRLAEVLEPLPPDLVLYGHLHQNRETVEKGTRCFCTASASSVNNASFRIIDINKEPDGWHCQVRLMTLEQPMTSTPAFRLAAESSWRR